MMAVIPYLKTLSDTQLLDIAAFYSSKPAAVGQAEDDKELLAFGESLYRDYFLFSSLVILVLENKFIGVFFLVVSFLVGISRIYLAKHLLSQVIMGGLVGIILGIAFYLIYKTWNQRQTSQ